MEKFGEDGHAVGAIDEEVGGAVCEVYDEPLGEAGGQLNAFYAG